MVKATVTEHCTYKDEAQTIVKRPVIVEQV